MNIQIFGSSKCFDTKKAERWFKERRIKYQYIDLPKKGFSAGEYRSVRQKLSFEQLVNTKCRAYEDLYMAYITRDAAEEKLNWVLLLTTVQMALNFFFFAVGNRYIPIGNMALLVNVAVFLVVMAVITVLQQKVVDQTRRLNPEKQGSVYDRKFKEKWLASCDEAEQRQIGQAA